MQPRLLVTRRLPEPVERRLMGRFDVQLNESDTPLDRAELEAAMTRFDGIYASVSGRIDADLLQAPGATVRIIANYGVGIDHIDLDAARQAGIVITNTPEVLTDATADVAIMLMLMASRRAGEAERSLRAGNWPGWGPTHFPGQSIEAKTFGVIGFGRIGQAAARRARAFGMRIAYHSRRRAAPEVEAEFDAHYSATPGELAEISDVVSLHSPGGPSTRHLVDAAFLARMKPTSILVNTARGTVVDEAALAAALQERRIAAAGLDVFEKEPEVHPALLGLENVVLLPHIGSATIETRIAMGMRAAENLECFFDGREPPDRVA